MSDRANRFWILALMAAGAAAQDRAPAIENKFDTAQAHVYVVTLLPHSPVPSRNGHATNRVLIYLDDGAVTRKDDGEKVQKFDVHRGEVRWRPASGAYVAENIGARPLRILEIDLKGKPAGAAPASKLDPTVVDAKHYKIVFENDQVRVLRVHYEGRDKGEEHEHQLNRVVLYLNDQPGAKRDEVRMSGAMTHTERNDSGAPADRIAVEIK